MDENHGLAGLDGIFIVKWDRLYLDFLPSFLGVFCKKQLAYLLITDVSLYTIILFNILGIYIDLSILGFDEATIVWDLWWGYFFNAAFGGLEPSIFRIFQGNFMVWTWGSSSNVIKGAVEKKTHRKGGFCGKIIYEWRSMAGKIIDKWGGVAIAKLDCRRRYPQSAIFFRMYQDVFGASAVLGGSSYFAARGLTCISTLTISMLPGHFT